MGSSSLYYHSEMLLAHESVAITSYQKETSTARSKRNSRTTMAQLFAGCKDAPSLAAESLEEREEPEAPARALASSIKETCLPCDRRYSALQAGSMASTHQLVSDASEECI